MIGVIIGIVMIVLGIVFCAVPADSSYTDYAEYASFGGDFYTYQYEATRIAAHNAADTANNVEAVGGMLALYAGAAFIFAGLLVALAYLKLYFTEDGGLQEAPIEEVTAEPVEAGTVYEMTAEEPVEEEAPIEEEAPVEEEAPIEEEAPAEEAE